MVQVEHSVPLPYRWVLQEQVPGVVVTQVPNAGAEHHWDEIDGELVRAPRRITEVSAQ